MGSYAALVYALLIAPALLDAVADWMNLRSFSPELPREFQGVYDPSRYRDSQRYQAESTRFDIARRLAATGILVAFIAAGGFNRVDLAARSFGWGPIPTGLAFAAILSLLKMALSLPFSVYDTFVIEQRHGFNRTTPATFAADLLKGITLGILLGAPALAGVLWFFEKTGSSAWLYAWGALTAFQILLVFVAPVLLMPIFNRFTPLPEGELARAIARYAREQGFRLSGIFTMDGSKRTTKANAFFTGFGRFRRLVLFDTLIEKQSVEELVAVVAHEVGHFKRGHILKSIALSVAATGAMFYALSLFIGNPGLFAAFGMENISIYASVVFVSLLAAPFFRALGVFTNLLSRRFEFEADDYSIRTFGQPETLVSALKKLSMDNSSHLTPHPLKVALDYSHPPILRRIEAIRDRARA